ncbi:hypothetical protein ACHAQA_002744 [Verticillium albo-atrum]
MSDSEEDYMSMAIPEPTTTKPPLTSLQRRKDQQRQSEARARQKSKAELAAEEEARRDAALKTSLLDAPAHQSSKGLAMMARMGFRPGGALGAQGANGSGGGADGARREPIAITIKEDRGGIGMESEKRKKMREMEEMEEEEVRKRVRVEEPGEYRDRIAREREAERVERMVASAQRVLEGMAEEAETEVREDGKKRRIKARPLKGVNVLWRGLARQREEKERDRRMRYDLEQSLSRLPTYEDEDEDEDDKRALGKAKQTVYEAADDLDEEDPELDEFKILEPEEKLKRLVAYMREEYHYCFWCKFRYPDESMEGCPGLTEEDHD